MGKRGELRFDGRVVIVTGAGAGLGRAYALLFAERGASVVVNDLGVARDGQGKSKNAADEVVEEIRRKGGVAVADYNSVVEGEKIVKTALDSFKRVDVLVNNAGILRDRSFARISGNDWDLIHDVHLKGAFKTTQAVWPHFRKQNYGRIILTSSNSGLYGNFGQANYSAAKMGLVGLSNTLAIEGRKNGINCNVIVPTAASRLTEDILPPDFFNELKPELIAPVVFWLCHEDCADTGNVIETAAGWAAKYFLMRGPGSLLRRKISDSVNPEDVRKNWEKVVSMQPLGMYGSIEEASGSLMGVIEEMKENDSTPEKNDKLNNNTEIVTGPTFDVNSYFCILYALGIGCSVEDESNLKFLYEGHEDFIAFPTCAILPSLMSVMGTEVMQMAVPNIQLDLSRILHGEQYLELYKPFPTSGRIRTEMKIADVLDKGKVAVIIIDAYSYDEQSTKVAYNQFNIVVVGAGNFGGKKSSNVSIDIKPHPHRQPDATARQKTTNDQAALYRLSGDYNPLHIDPNFALLGGFKRPILHGLCSLGFSARHVLSKFGGNDPTNFKAIKARFAKVVYPGETLETRMWKEGNRIFFETAALERGTVVISGGYVDLHQSVASISASPVSSEELKSKEVFKAIEERLKANKELAKKINGVFLYNITKNGNICATWTLDLKEGKVYEGNPKDGVKVDTTLTLSDGDMVDIATGKLNPQAAFMKGKLKIKGNLMLTQKLKGIMNAEAKL